ncbi:signal peptide peptidase SppA [Anaerobacillus sp. MEB173]|uniref:signal peptide peptidase SppA n=1 Tax=Anaerobacillus sp. MEB173 TaxID=3383345 RepID=UPI003F8E2BB5
MSKKRWLALGIAVVLLLASTAFNMMSAVAFGNWENIFEGTEDPWIERVIEKGEGNGKIVLLSLNGVIQEAHDAPSLLGSATYHHRNFLSMLDRAGEDPFVEGIIIRVNSPGGGVVESAEIHDKITEIQSDYQKPIYISMGSMAASGGYYIAAPADKIVANPSTITGSLGVIFQTINVSELAENFGVKVETVKSGPYKDIMSSTREITDAERAILQSMIDESYDQFVDVIATGRGLSEEKVRQLADGRIYTGKQAKELQLIDELGSLETTIELLQEEIGRGNLEVVKYETAFGFGSFFSMAAQKMFSSDFELIGLKEALLKPNSPSLMYLYSE